MDKNDINDLLHKLASNQASASEHKAFTSWVNKLDKDAYQEILDQYYQILLQYPQTGKPLPKLERQIEHRLDQLPASTKTIPLRRYWDVAMVASILLLATAGTWYALGLLDDSPTNSSPATHITSRYGGDVRPGTDKAILTLSDGQTIVLDDIPEGKLDLDGGLRVIKTGEGAISYDFTTVSPSHIKQPTYHTITTPVGGEYQITLPDGSRVWLNSMSSITAPDAFSEDQRMVEVTGEVFFDIAESKSATGKKIPFLVKTASQTVKVLGTQFNIKAYNDNDAVETTLIEGKVEVRTPGKMTMLKPGEQTRVKQGGQLDHVKNINIAKVIAWKNGYFQFSDDSIQDIMKQLKRWYDIEVAYIGAIPDSRFGGQISRKRNISEVLRILELTDEVTFKIEGKKVKIWTK